MPQKEYFEQIKIGGAGFPVPRHYDQSWLR